MSVYLKKYLDLVESIGRKVCSATLVSHLKQIISPVQ